MGFFMGSLEMKLEQARRSQRLVFVTLLPWLVVLLSLNSQVLAGLDLEVPVEMVDYGLQSNAGTGTTNFNRSWIYLDPAGYHNATYYFEVIATNTHTTSSYNVELRSTSTSTTYASITVPANTTIPNRFRTASAWTPPAGKNEFLIRASNTPSERQLLVYNARILVQQTNADYTRIQIPLVHRLHDGVASGPGFVDKTTSTVYEQLNTNRYCLWKKDVNKYVDLSGSTPWTLEVVLDHDSATGTAHAALFNTTSGQVEGAEVSNYGNVIALVEVSFSNTANKFTNGSLFELKIRSGTTMPQAELRRASLYVSLTNLTKAEVLYRVAGRINGTSATDIVHQRAFIDTSLFSNPTVFFQASGWCADNFERAFVVGRAFGQ